MTRAANPSPAGGARGGDVDAMRRAIALAASVRPRTAPNPWVGCVVRARDRWFEGATEPPGGAHAEIVALRAAGAAARGATLVTTLEPCCHHGRTPPCVDAIVAAGVRRVVVGMLDPDPNVSGGGVAALRAAGIEVDVGLAGTEVAAQLAPYVKHRTTGRPWVVLKLAASLDGRIAAPDGTSQWLTGPAARADAHRLRAESEAVLVGAGTVRADDPRLTVRLGGGGEAGGSAPDPVGTADADTAGNGADQADTGGWRRQPLRVVLGRAPAGARVHPALELTGDLGDVLDELGRRGVLQVLVEGGARVAYAFHRARLVDRYVLYLAPVLFGGDDGVPLFAGPGAPSMGQLWRGRLVGVTRLGEDLRIDLAPDAAMPGTEAA